MTLTLLFDLDDTLLDTNLDAFIPAYFQGLSKHLSGFASSEKLLNALLSGMSLMDENKDPASTLMNVLDSHFYPKLGISKSDVTGILDDFYDNIFPSFGALVRQKPEAVPIIEWALACGYRVAIATDPFFPRRATFNRLRWAGLDPEQFEVVSTYENFHFSKAHPAYYAEMLGQLGWPDGPVLMVGNDVQRDLIQANRLGLKTYLIDGDSASRPGFETGRGKLADLRPWLESNDLSTLEPAFKSPDAILGIMQSTPAVLESMLASISVEQWRLEPSSDDWAFNEIICHLRDTEREIHHLQLELMLGREDAFIPRPDTGVWASERDYLHVDGNFALQEFTSARKRTIDLIENSGADIWSRKARHAIFGPTNFLEVCSFMVDHDRMHVQQACKTVKNLTSGRVLSGADVL
jgi:FMN phosphatase YigB (HAD superfamily)